MEQQPQQQVVADDDAPSLRLVVDGVDKFGTKKEAEKWLLKWGVAREDFSKVKKVNRKAFMHVTATSEEAFNRIAAIIEGKEGGKGKKLRVKRHERKRPTREGEEGAGAEGNNNNNNNDNNDNQHEGALKKPKANDVRDVTTPLWKMPYDEQLKKKQLELEGTLQNMFKRTKKMSKELKPWPLLRNLSPILPSPVLEGYRNKLQFSVGYDKNKKICLGFREGRTEDGTTSVGDPNIVIFCAPEALEVRNALQKIVEDERVEGAELPPYDVVKHTGFWRSIEVRTNLDGEALVVLQVSEKHIGSEALVAELKARIVARLNQVCPRVVGIAWQNSLSKSTISEDPIVVIFGRNYLVERLEGVSFEVPFAAFFQTNTRGCVTLYDVVARLVDQEVARLTQPGKEISVFDVCCGTGTIGLYLRHKLGVDKVKTILGIDIVPESIQAAQKNAALNNMTEGVKFIASPAEVVMNDCLTEAKTRTVIAVVDPPRPGLHPKVLKALRNAEFVKSIVYVSCNPKSLANDTAPLCKSKSNEFHGEAFEPVFFQGVDMFPHMDHVESVVLFKRKEAEKKEQQAGEGQEAGAEGGVNKKD